MAAGAITILAILLWLMPAAIVLTLVSRKQLHGDLTDDAVSNAGDVRQVEVLNFHSSPFSTGAQRHDGY